MRRRRTVRRSINPDQSFEQVLTVGLGGSTDVKMSSADLTIVLLSAAGPGMQLVGAASSLAPPARLASMKCARGDTFCDTLQRLGGVQNFIYLEREFITKVRPLEARDPKNVQVLACIRKLYGT